MEIISVPGFSEPLSSWSHLLGAFIALVGTPFLLSRGKGNGWRTFSLVVYSFCLIFMFSMSGVYHLLEPKGTPRYVLMVLDHAGIWVMIAGSFTPFHTILFRGIHRWGILALVWILTIVGLTLTSIFMESMPDAIMIGLFLGMGWIGAGSYMGMKRTYKNREINPRLVIYGGAAYTVGAIIKLINWPVLWPGIAHPHEIFHLFVMAGAAFHWLFIYQIARRPLASKLVFYVKEFPNGEFRARAKNEWAQFQSCSVEGIKTQIHDWVDSHYHKNFVPKKIKLKHSKQETLFL